MSIKKLDILKKKSKRLRLLLYLALNTILGIFVGLFILYFNYLPDQDIENIFEYTSILLTMLLVCSGVVFIITKKQKKLLNEIKIC
jgi:uncharacterized membrane protein YfcA